MCPFQICTHCLKPSLPDRAAPLTKLAAKGGVHTARPLTRAAFGAAMASAGRWCRQLAHSNGNHIGEGRHRQGSWGFYLPLSPILLRSGAHPNPVLWDNLEG